VQVPVVVVVTVTRTWPKRLCMAALAVAATSVGGAADVSRSAPTASPTRVAGYGIGIELPRGWDGRVYKPDALSAVTLLAATFQLPSSVGFQTSWDSTHSMTHDDVRIVLWDYGVEGMTREALLRDGVRARGLPIEVERSDFAPFGGMPRDHAVANSAILESGRFLQLVVDFGSEPSDARIAAVNAVLSRLAVSRTDD
jgi:hypothetical protein